MQRSIKASLANIRRTNQSDRVPYLVGDPFTDSQEYPDSFSIDKADCKKTTGATVKVIFAFGDEKRWVILKLIPEDNDWKIDNVFSGTSLLDDLKK